VGLFLSAKIVSQVTQHGNKALKRQTIQTNDNPTILLLYMCYLDILRLLARYLHLTRVDGDKYLHLFVNHINYGQGRLSPPVT
jgi:hypothetical protein